MDGENEEIGIRNNVACDKLECWLTIDQLTVP